MIKQSSEELTLLYNGATANELAILFDMSVNEVRRKIIGVVDPITGPNKVPRFRVREAAPYLCSVVFDPEEMIRTLTPAKLPPALSHVFWKAQKDRQDFEERKGDLWRTQRVIEVFSEVFKTIRMTILMFNDTLEQRADVSPEQRKIIQQLGDGLLDQAHEALVKKFESYVPPADEHGRPLAEEKSGAVVEPPEDFDDGFGE